MEIASVRALKAEVSEKILAPLLREAREIRAFGLAAKPMRNVTGAQRGIALGITRGRNKKDYRLAVRIQRRALEQDAALRQRLEDSSKQEVDIRYVGRINKRGGAVAPDAATLPWYRDRQRPLLIGCSIGHFAITAGTVGGVFLHRKTLRPVILSNNHVLANENAGKIGDALLQPGAYDGGRKTKDRVGALLDFVHLKSSGSNLVDAAIGSIDADIRYDAATLTGFGRLRGVRGQSVEPGDQVVKIGRTTGLTRGIVTAIELDDVVVGFDGGALSFDRQIEIEGAGDAAFSSGGDSGSLIFDADGDGCGLLFAGGDQGGSNGKGLTYANDLSLVMESLNVELALDALTS